MQVLTPKEFEVLREVITDFERKTQLDFLLLSGMRYAEAIRLHKNRAWFSNGFIHLPSEKGQRKKKRSQKERWVRLNKVGKDKTEAFLHTRGLPSINGWNQLMLSWGEKAGIRDKELSAKTTRKTWESWLVHYYPNRYLDVALSQGHTAVTQLQHYLNMPFTVSDKEGMKPWVEGWI